MSLAAQGRSRLLLDPTGPGFVVRAPHTLAELTLEVFCHRDQFALGFEQWLEENFHVWTRFMQEADKLRARGRTHYSARTIIEVLRHESALSDTDKQFKINDHCAPSLARLYMLVTEGADGFFETRPLAKDRTNRKEKPQCE